MSYAGTVLDMINRMKANMAMRKARRKKFWGQDDLQDTNIEKGQLSDQFSEEVSPAIKAQRARDTQAVIQADQRKRRLLIGLVIIITAVASYYLLTA